MSTRMHYEEDSELPDTVIVRGWRCYVLGWETEPDADTEWTGIEAHTGNYVCRMVGDDKDWSVDPEDCEVLPRERVRAGPQVVTVPPFSPEKEPEDVQAG